MLRRNGIRHPQTRKCVAGDLAERQHRQVGEKQAGRDAELGPRGHETAMRVGLGPLHRHQDRSSPLAPDSDALDEAQDVEQHRTPDADLLIGGHECNQECRYAHQQQSRDERRFAADAIAVMPEDRCADRPSHESDGIDPECLQRSDQRIGFREIQLAEHQSRYRAVQKEVVPLDGGADGARNDRAPELPAVVGLRGQGCHALRRVRYFALSSRLRELRRASLVPWRSAFSQK